MSRNILIQPAYFAPIAQYAAILQAKSIVFEQQDNFVKQTYRNRCYVYAANGKLTLNVPVLKTKGIKKTLTKNTPISYVENWQVLHLKSLKSAYRSSPFFEYYEDDLNVLFKNTYKTLEDLHKACHEFVMDALLEDAIQTSFSKEYQIHPTNLKDLRHYVDAKTQPNITFPSYIQVFDDKHGFLPNLSILDLIFMEGPAASIYLLNLNTNAFS